MSPVQLVPNHSLYSLFTNEVQAEVLVGPPALYAVPFIHNWLVILAEAPPIFINLPSRHFEVSIGSGRPLYISHYLPIWAEKSSKRLEVGGSLSLPHSIARVLRLCRGTHFGVNKFEIRQNIATSVNSYALCMHIFICKLSM